MKKLTLIFTAVLVSVIANATIRTVSNFPANVAQYSTIDAAIAVSAAGDTILVNGSPNSYGGFTVDKKLTVIGPGVSPNKQLAFTAVVSGMYFSNTASSGSELQGLTFNSTISIVTNGGVNNLRFIRNNFINMDINFNCCSGGTYTGYLFEGNVFDNSRVGARPEASYADFVFQNNYFYENGCCRNGNITGFQNASNILFDHNLWFGPASGSRTAFSNDNGGSNRYLTLTNNIFVHRDASLAVNSTFNNNLTFNAGTNAPWSVNGNINTAGNIENLDPQMVDQAGVNAGTDNSLQDFTIAAGPANNTGSDGKDIGLLYDAVGSLNWTNSRMARLPYINTMNITTPTVAPGGNVQVSVQAKTNN